MPRFLFISLVAIILRVAWAEEIETPDNVAAEIEAKYPAKNWKTIGFCNPKGVPLMEMRVPGFVSWDPKCEYHTVKNGIEYCGPDDSSPRLMGTIKIGAKERILLIGMEAFDHVKPYYYPGSDMLLYWQNNGLLLSRKEIKLGGHAAQLGEIESSNGKSPDSALKSQTLIVFERPYIGGTLYFNENEGDKSGERIVPHSKRVFQKVIDRIIDTFQFKVAVEDSDKPKPKGTARKSK